MILFERKHKTRNYEGVEIPVETSFFKLELSKITTRAKMHTNQEAHDEGTAVIGAGIKMQLFPKGARTPIAVTLVRAPFQGNVGSHKALKPVLEYIQKTYPQLNAYWEDGNMD